ncbi:MAG: type II secretion system secretin GspD [Alphaproteobacteria bacterium]|uniref:Type II secretion system secretin GspD n=1 Tax=Candidatus Nitrobium versatile TaxID=2884831 RepID=A0A953JCG0_9BACT|nr:type II secretion system secretin GspD [Candidatus Nitrobium versatile]
MSSVIKGIMAVLICVALFGCASAKGARSAAVQGEAGAQPAAAASAGNAMPKRSEAPLTPEELKPANRVEELSLPSFAKPAPQKSLPGKVEKEPIDPKRIVHAEGPVLVNAEAMPLSDFVIYALGDILKVTFFIDEQVKNMKNPVTLRMAREMPADKVIEIVIGFLEKHDLTVEERGGALYITKAKVQPPKPPVDIRIGRTVPDSPAEILQVIPLKYIKFAELEYIVRTVYKSNVNIWQNYKDSTLLVSGPASAVREVAEIAELFDVPYIVDKKIVMLKLIYWQPEEFIKQISAILQGLNFPTPTSIKEPGVVFMPIKFLNTVLVIAPDEESLKYVVDWYRKLDTDESAGSSEKAFTYSPRFSKASDLVESLGRLYGISLAPSGPLPSSVSAPPPSLPAAKPGAPGQQQTQSSLAVGGLRLAADDKRNVILIRATPSEYRSILSYLEKLDMVPKQVLIETTIAELTLKDDLNYGLEWYIKNKMISGDYVLQTLGQLGLGATGLTYQFTSSSEKVQVLLNAFAQENKINVISSPRLMVLDNEESSIQIGSDIPIITGETKSTSADQQTTITTQSVQYRSTGLILTVRPTINTDGILTLNIALESSEAQSNTLSSVSSPLILTRKLNTIVVASTGRSIILGGLMSDNDSNTDTKVPLIGDIPLLGNLFKNTSKSKTKTELIILLTPRILTNTDDAVRLTDELKQGIQWFK